MKLRPTLSTAAVTAATAVTTAVVPAVLLLAPVAHADGGAPQPTPRVSGPAAGASVTPSPAASPTPAESQTPPASPTASAPGSTVSPSASAPEVPACNNGPASKVHFALKGLPSKIAAGGGWHDFTLTVTDTSDVAVGDVEASITVNNGSASENADLYLHSYLEYWDAAHSKWLSLKDEGKDDIRETGIIYGYTNLKAHQSDVLKFRLQIDTKATLGSGYAVGGGTYVEPGQNCSDGTTVESVFEVVAPGKGGTSGQGSRTATGGDGGGDLAETGSSSAMPLIAAVGGLAVLAGGGTVIMARRRRNGAGGEAG